MSRFLEKIVEEKRIELSHKQRRTPLKMLESRVAAASPVRDFRGALSGGQRIIAEVKKRSPRVKKFRQTRAADALPLLYERNGASALSVVTDNKNFGTSLTDAKRYRETVTLPVLVKDFVIDPYQVYEARVHNADAVLLIARLLSGDQLKELHDVVLSLRMQANVEVHTTADVQKALDVGARIIGINNRDLDGLKVSLDTTRELARAIPDEAVSISESGIHGREQIEELTELGIDAFLVGGALLDSKDPAELLRSLLGKGNRNATNIKSDEEPRAQETSEDD